MSGPKQTRIRPSQQRLARRQLAPLVAPLQAARATLAKLSAATCRGVHRELGDAVRVLRAELVKFRGTPEARSSMLAAVRSVEACGARLEVAAQSAPSLADAEALSAEIGAFISGNSSGSIESAASRARHVIDRAEHLAVAHREALETLDSVRALMKPTDDAPSDAQLAATKLLAAARATIQNESKELEADDHALLMLGAFDRAAHDAAIRSAHETLGSGDAEAASGFTDRARSMRLAARLRGSEVRTEIAMRDEIAAHLAATLRDRNYDECQAYLKPGPGGDERPLVIYANNPSGTAHVRITLPLHDSMTIEVDGVANGEEEICVDVLESFQKALEATGDGMDMIDLGRATPFLARVRERALQRERQRESGR
jgi:hypothetical protein